MRFEKFILSTLFLGVAYCSAITGSNTTVTEPAIKYGEKIFLQNMRNNNRWLSGRRYGRGDVVTLNQRSTDEVEHLKNYEIYIRSDLTTPLSQTDPKADECVKYGDKVHFGFGVDDDGVAFLKGSLHYGGTDLAKVVGSARTQVEAQKFKVGTHQYAYSTWELRSKPGLGRIDGSDPDLAVGHCIVDLSALYIQNMAKELKMARGRRYLYKAGRQ